MIRSLITLGLIMATTSAFGQTPDFETGSRIAPLRAKIPAESQLSKFDQGRLVMAQFAGCLLNRMAGKIGEALTQVGDKQVNFALLETVNHSDCLSSGQIRFQVPVVRDALFVELFRRRDGGSTAFKLPAYDLSEISARPDMGAVHLWMIDFASCVVERDRSASRLFVLAPVASAAERTAFEGLKPSLGPCVTAGDEIDLNFAVIKGALAEILYRGAMSSTSGKPN